MPKHNIPLLWKNHPTIFLWTARGQYTYIGNSILKLGCHFNCLVGIEPSQIDQFIIKSGNYCKLYSSKSSYLSFKYVMIPPWPLPLNEDSWGLRHHHAANSCAISDNSFLTTPLPRATTPIAQLAKQTTWPCLLCSSSQNKRGNSSYQWQWQHPKNLNPSTEVCCSCWSAGTQFLLLTPQGSKSLPQRRRAAEGSNIKLRFARACLSEDKVLHFNHFWHIPHSVFSGAF